MHTTRWAGVYFIVADDRQRGDYLVIQVMVDGPATVMGRWDDEADAQADARRWTALEAEAA